MSFVRTRRARHYILRVGDDGALRVTLPWHGSKAEALRFVHERRDWIERERYRRALGAASHGPWQAGTPILYRGEQVEIAVAQAAGGRLRITFGDQALTVPADAASSLRPHIERHLRRCATIELPERLARLARLHGFDVRAVSIRGQRSRWGSCSASGRISLNWRLIQLPLSVAEYVLIHELVHLRHLNHSRRFWSEVGRLCPDWQDARRWLRTHGAGSLDRM